MVFGRNKNQITSNKILKTVLSFFLRKKAITTGINAREIFKNIHERLKIKKPI